MLSKLNMGSLKQNVRQIRAARGETDVEGITNDNLDSCDSVNSSRWNDSTKNGMFGK
jgi:hypothetical protein